MLSLITYQLQKFAHVAKTKILDCSFYQSALFGHTRLAHFP